MARGEGGGRPMVELTEEQIAQVEALAAFLSTEQIADYFGIGRNTFYQIMRREDDVSVRYKRGRAKAIATLAKGLLKDAIDGNERAREMYLKTQAGWSEKSQLDHVSSDGSMTPTIIQLAPATAYDASTG
jgi:broad specificity phosphatase PhoE